MSSGSKKHFITLSGGSFLGKLLGFCRELLMAAVWGTSYIVSAFCIAQSTIIIAINLLVGETLNAGFVPLLRKKLDHDRENAYILEYCIFIILMLIALTLSLTIYSNAQLIVSFMSPGFDAQARDMATAFIKIFSFSIPLCLLGQFFACSEMAHGSFFLQAIRPSIQSLGMIAGISLTFIYNQPLLMAWGFVAAYGAFSAIGAYRMLKSTNHIKRIPPLFKLKKEFSSYLSTIYPLLLLPVIIQIAMWAEKAIASLISTDSIAALSYAKFITESGLNLLAVPLGFIGLSMLGSMPHAESKKWIEKKIAIILLLTIPASIALFVHADKVVTIIYARGAFNEKSIINTTPILQWAGVGLWVQVCGYLLMKALNARLMHKQYIVIIIIAFSCQVLFSYLLYSYGNWVLGTAISINGLIASLGGGCFFKIFKGTATILCTMLLGAFCYWLSSELVPLLAEEFIVSAIYFIVFWLAWICSIKPLRAEAIYLLKQGVSR